MTALTVVLAGLSVLGYAVTYRLTKQLHSARATLEQIATLDTTHHSFTAARLAKEGLKACSVTS